MELHILRASTEPDINAAFATLAQVKANALLIDADALFISHSKQLAALAAQHAVLAVHAARDFVVAGGLMSYGNSPAESYRQAGVENARPQRAKHANRASRRGDRISLAMCAFGPKQT